MPDDVLDRRVASDWTNALRQAQLLYAHLYPGYQLRSAEELEGLAHATLSRHRDPSHLIHELFPEHSPDSASHARR